MGKIHSFEHEEAYPIIRHIKDKVIIYPMALPEDWPMYDRRLYPSELVELALMICDNSFWVYGEAEYQKILKMVKMVKGE